MGYTHYWYTKKELDRNQWNNFLSDARKIINYSENVLGIKLANGGGEGEPDLNNEFINLNGSDSQPVGIWTTSEHITLAWPSDNAGLIDPIKDPIESKKAGNWFAGNLICQRVAPIDDITGLGSGSYESFSIYRQSKGPAEFIGDYVFDCCKTSYRPYDLTVTALLISLQYHFPETVIKTDGQLKDWQDGQRLCLELFNYGENLVLDRPSPEKKQQEGYKFEGSKYRQNSNLTTKEIAAKIREELKTKHPNCVFSVTKESYSGGASISIDLMAAPFEALKCYYKNNWVDGVRKTENYQDDKGHAQLGIISKDYENGQSNGAVLTLEAWEVMKDAQSIANSYNYDDSDSMTDYFNTNFYLHLNIGKWNKPFKVIEAKEEPKQVLKAKEILNNACPVTVRRNLEKKGIEVIFQRKPEQGIIEALKAHGFRWSGFSKLWYNRDTETNWTFANSLI